MNKNWQTCEQCKCSINPILGMCSCGWRPPKQQFSSSVNSNEQIPRDPNWKAFRFEIVCKYGEEIAKKHLDPYKDCKSCESALESIREMPNTAFKAIGLKLCENINELATETLST